MARDGRYRKESGDQTIDMGLLQITLRADRDQYAQSAITLHINAKSPSFVEPVITEYGRQPSTADKLIALTKQALTEEGMTVIEDGSDLPPVGDRDERQKQLALRTYSSFNPGSRDPVILAEQGYYEGVFNAATMVKKAGAVLNKIAAHVKDARTVKAVEGRINDIYIAVDEYQKPLDEALDRSHLCGPQAQMADAISVAIPDPFLSDERREMVVDAIMNAVLDDGGKLKQRTDNKYVRGTPDDPLQQMVLSVLTKHEVGVGKVRDFLAREICDVIYQHQLKGVNRAG